MVERVGGSASPVGEVSGVTGRGAGAATKEEEPDNPRAERPAAAAEPETMAKRVEASGTVALAFRAAAGEDEEPPPEEPLGLAPPLKAPAVEPEPAAEPAKGAEP